MKIKKAAHRALVKVRKFYYARIMHKPRIIFSESNLKHYRNEPDISYLESFR